MQKISLKFRGIRIPVIIHKEGKWCVAEIPQLDLATKGRTIEEAKEYVQDLLYEYFSDPDTYKPEPEALMNIDISLVPLPEGVKHKTQTAV
jgi:predicted RNase H-like HicB family nuclease